jgi:PPOX class probable F420-dependent enzyme
VQGWNDVTSQLDAGDFMSFDNDGPSHYTTWLTTLNPDGSPHVTAVGAVWDDDTFWFQTGDPTRKAHNIERDPRCAVSVTLDGCDVVVEGVAQKVSDPDVVAHLAEVWSSRGGWPATLDATGTGLTAPFNAPGLGPPPWFVYRVVPTSATSVTDDGRSTRWTF